MPSPTSSTRTTSRVSILAPYCSISDCRTETISSALNLMTASRKNLITNVVDTGSHGGVVLPVADANLEAAQDGGIDLDVQHRLDAERASDVAHQPVFLGRIEVHSGRHVNARAALEIVVQLTQF